MNLFASYFLPDHKQATLIFNKHGLLHHLMWLTKENECYEVKRKRRKTTQKMNVNAHMLVEKRRYNEDKVTEGL